MHKCASLIKRETIKERITPGFLVVSLQILKFETQVIQSGNIHIWIEATLWPSSHSYFHLSSRIFYVIYVLLFSGSFKGSASLLIEKHQTALFDDNTNCCERLTWPREENLRCINTIHLMPLEKRAKSVWVSPSQYMVILVYVTQNKITGSYRT